MTIPGWPASLRQTPRRNTWTGGPLDFRRRFAPDRGDDIVRRSTTAEVMAFDGVVFPNLSGTQRVTFEAFYVNELQGGSLPFSWHDPVTGEAWLWRINGDGRLGYAFTSKGADNHDLTLSLIRRPGRPWWSPYTAPRLSTVPALVLDFANQRYGVNGELRGLDSLLTFSRASSATRTTGAGMVETVASGAMRLDHDPLTGTPIGLLMEEARTNLCLRSEEFDNATWSKFSATVVANVGALSPSGTSTSERVVMNAAAPADTAGVQQLVAFGASAAVSASVWVKSSGKRAKVLVQARNGAAVVIGQASATVNFQGTMIEASAVSGFTDGVLRLVQYPDGWARVVFDGVTPALTASVYLVIISPDVGDGTNGMLVWGAQIEAGAFATSYIPTTTVTVTRAAEFATVTGSYSEWSAADDGTLVRRIRPGRSLIGPASAPMITALSNAGITDNLLITMLTDPTSPAADARVTVASVLQAETDNLNLAPPVLGQELDQAAAWQGGSLVFAQGGTVTAPAAFAASPVNDRLFLMLTPNTAHLSRVILFRERIADEFLSAITA